MKLLPVALVVAASLCAPAVSYAQVKPNNPDAPVSSEQPVQPEPDPAPPTPPPTPPTPDNPPAPDTISATDPQSLMAFLVAAGLKPELGANNVGRTKITFTLQGAVTSIYYYDCHDGMGDCDSIRLVHGLDLPDGTTLAAVNRWNTTEPWGRASLDDNADPWLDHPLWVGSNMPTGIFNATMGNWAKAVAKFKLHFEDK